MRLNAVSKTHGGNPIFENVNLELVPGARLGLTGPNGSGKTTLLRMIAGLERPDSGAVSVPGRVVLLKQQPERHGGTASEAVRPVELREAEKRLRKATGLLGDPTEANLEAYARAEERYRSLGGYDHAARAAKVLTGLGLDPEAPCDRFSGGEWRRLQLARLLLQKADILLLDEPTNHLDTGGITWLENWLRGLDGTLLIVSHDRDFLDVTTDSTAVLEGGRLRVWPGAWSAAMAAREAEDAARGRRRDAQLRRRRSLELEAGRLSSKARSAGNFNKRRAGNQALILSKAKAENVSRTLARRAETLRRRAEALDVPEAAPEADGPGSIPLPENAAGPGEVLRLENLTLERGGRTLVRGLDLLLRRGEKLAVTGPNGSGKTTLLETAAGMCSPTAGRVIQGHGLTIFTMSQDGRELAEAGTIEGALRTAQPVIRRQDLHHLLARLGLPGEPDTPVGLLSGGERSRLALACLSITRAALLVLDEPTNNLDVPMIGALEELLVRYPGTVLFTTHDRRLLREVAGRTLSLSEPTPQSRSAGSSSPR